MIHCRQVTTTRPWWGLDGLWSTVIMGLSMMSVLVSSARVVSLPQFTPSDEVSTPIRPGAAGLPLAARSRFPGLVPAAAALGVVLFAGALGALRSGRRGRPERAAGWLVGSMAAAGLLVVGAVQPWIDRYENLSGFAAQVKAVLRPEVPFGTTEQKREAWVFYTGRAAEELDTDESVVAYLARPGPRDLLIEEAKLAPLRDRLPRDLVEVVRGRVTGQSYFLLRREAAR